MDKPRILVVDDEEALRSVLKYNLEMEGYAVDTAESAEEALAKPIASYALLLLDVMMDGMDGFALARRIKDNAATAHVPIIFCTAKDTENDTVAGLTLGADDYIAKPFSVRELVARVRSVLRRTAGIAPKREPEAVHHALDYEGLHVDLDKKLCSTDGTPVELTKKEFEILVLLLQHREVIFSREDILTRIWPDDVVVVVRTVDVTITRLRKKLGTYGNHIITRHGYGYGFEG